MNFAHSLTHSLTHSFTHSLAPNPFTTHTHTHIHTHLQDCAKRTCLDKEADERRFFLTPALDTLVHYPAMMEGLAELIGKREEERGKEKDGHGWRRIWWNVLK